MGEYKPNKPVLGGCVSAEATQDFSIVDDSPHKAAWQIWESAWPQSDFLPLGEGYFVEVPHSFRTIWMFPKMFLPLNHLFSQDFNGFSMLNHP